MTPGQKAAVPWLNDREDYERIARLRIRRDNWDGHGSKGVSDKAVVRGQQALMWA